jgi:enoyl-CoA hydratase/carnithine racemase
METGYFRHRRMNRTLWLELCNPPVNFITVDILAELHRLIKAADRDESLRVLILTGGVEDRYIFHFSIPEIRTAARDIQRLHLGAISRSWLGGPLLRGATALTLGLMRRFEFFERAVLRLSCRWRGRFPALFMMFQMLATYDAIERSRKITVAAINGTCNGGGTEMAACFDFRFMVEDAGFTIGQPEVLVGIVPGGGGTQRVARLIGKARALEFMLTCDQWSPQRAAQAGLLTAHFPRADFEEAVQAFADRMSKRSPVAAFEARRAIHEGLDLDLRRGLAQELSSTLQCCDDTATAAALTEYSAILDELIFARPDQPATINEVMAVVESDRLTRHYERGN